MFGACAPTTRATTVDRGASSATVARSEREHWLGMFARGYFPGRSGQVFVVSKAGDFVTYRDPLYRFMHGSPHDYDSHIPLLFHGAAFVTPGAVFQIDAVSGKARSSWMSRVRSRAKRVESSVASMVFLRTN